MLVSSPPAIFLVIWSEILHETGTEASNKYLVDKEIVQIHTIAMDTGFGTGDTYPYKIQAFFIFLISSFLFYSTLS